MNNSINVSRIRNIYIVVWQQHRSQLQVTFLVKHCTTFLLSEFTHITLCSWYLKFNLYLKSIWHRWKLHEITICTKKMILFAFFTSIWKHDISLVAGLFSTKIGTVCLVHKICQSMLWFYVNKRHCNEINTLSEFTNGNHSGEYMMFLIDCIDLPVSQ